MQTAFHTPPSYTARALLHRSTPARTMRTLRLALLATALCLSQAVFAERGSLGIQISVDADGISLNPTLKTVKVAKVIPHSPAALAGITANDLIIEVEGRPVAGAKANDLVPLMQRQAGETLRLVVQKPSGDRMALTVTLAPRAR